MKTDIFPDNSCNLPHALLCTHMLTMADDLLLLNPSEEELKELNFDNLDYDLLDREDDEVPGPSTTTNKPPSDAANPSSSSMPNLANRTVVIGSEASKKKSAEMKKIRYG